MYPTLFTFLGVFIHGTWSWRRYPHWAAEPVVTTLPNGLTVLVQEDTRFPLASLRLYVRAGSAYETPEQAGISHLLEHMVFKGTANRAPGQVASDVEGAGGALNAATSFDYTVFYTDMPADQWRLGMDVLHDMVFNASIDPEELAREKQVVLAELKRNEDTPESLLFKAGPTPDVAGHRLRAAHHRHGGDRQRHHKPGYQGLHRQVLPAPIHAPRGLR